MRSKCAKMALLSYVCPDSTTITGSRNMVRVMGHESSSGSSSRSASGASGTSLRALAERRVRTPWVVFPDVGSGAADVLRRLEGAIERTSGVAPGARSATLTWDESVQRKLLEAFFLCVVPKIFRRWRTPWRARVCHVCRFPRARLGPVSTCHVQHPPVMKRSPNPRKFACDSHGQGTLARGRLSSWPTRSPILNC